MTDGYAILVCGPQSHGNHLAAEIVRRCMNSDETVRADDGAGYEKHLSDPRLILWGALPCGKRAGWTWLDYAVSIIQHRSTLALVIPMRSWAGAAKSAVNHLHVANMNGAYESFTEALIRIFQVVERHGLAFHILSYEGLMAVPQIEIAELASFLGQPFPELDTLVLKDANPHRWAELAKGERLANGKY